MALQDFASNTFADLTKADIPVLSLVPETKTYGRGETITFKLLSDPAVAASPTYDFQVPFVRGTEGLRVAIESHQSLQSVFTGTTAATFPQRNSLAISIYKDVARTQYDSGVLNGLAQRVLAATQVHRETVMNDATLPDDAARQAALAALIRNNINRDNIPDDVDAGISQVIVYMCPYKGLQRVKRYLRRKCRKPDNMPVTEFINHFMRINDVEIPMMPPNFNDAQKLSVDEMIDVLMFAFPRKWQIEMERQGFDPLLGTVGTLIEFCQRLESAESMDRHALKGKGKSDDRKQAGRNNRSNRDGYKNHKKYDPSQERETGKQHYCMHHGKNFSHSTDDCNILKKMARENKEGRPKHGNKTWNRKGSDERKELAAFVRKSVQQELHAVSKKRKTSDDEGSTGSLNAFEKIDLDKFNYNDMDNLKIDSDDDFGDDEIQA